MISASEQKILDVAAQRRREDYEASRIRAREMLARNRDAQRATIYKIPAFDRVANIKPNDPWQDIDPRSLTVDALRAADPKSVPPRGWFHMQPDTRARLGGTILLFIDRFPQDADRRRRARILDAVSTALAAAASLPERLDELHRMHDSTLGPVIEAFGALPAAEWILVKHDLHAHGDTRLLRDAIEKLDHPTGVLAVLIEAFRSALRAAVGA